MRPSAPRSRRCAARRKRRASASPPSARARCPPRRRRGSRRRRSPQGLAATLSAFDTVEPALKAFYAALNDEQKARLYRDMAANAAVETTGRAEAQDERGRAPRHFLAPAPLARFTRGHRATQRRARLERHREELAGVLRNWPVREIERDVRLTSAQRVAFYELVTSVFRAGDTLANACPLTPVGRMEAMRQRLSAARAATAAIRPPLARFYEALDQGQQ